MRIALLAVVFLIAACSSDSDNGALVGPDPGGDDDGNRGQTEEVRFSTDVQPVFAASCAGSGCHVGGSANGVNLSSWSAALGSQGLQYGGPVIVPGNSAVSPLIDKLGSSPQFGSRMPQGRAALPATTVQTIAEWIDAGAPNN